MSRVSVVGDEWCRVWKRKHMVYSGEAGGTRASEAWSREHVEGTGSESDHGIVESTVSRCRLGVA